MAEIFIEGIISLEQVARSLYMKNSTQDIIELIKEIDFIATDSEFTKELYNYFKNEIEKLGV